MKTCFKCHQVKPLDGFYPHQHMKDGRLNKCIECAKKDVLARLNKVRLDPAWMAKERERCRVKAHRYRKPETLEQRRQRNKKYFERHPDRRSAQITAGNALRDGKIQKPSACSACGLETSHLEKHHDDYSKPLDIRWLCIKCHALTRRK